MIYITTRLPARYHKVSLQELWYSTDINTQCLGNEKETDTRTYVVNHLRTQHLNDNHIHRIIKVLKEFNNETRELRKVPRHELYRKFHIPKKKGGLREINAPNPQLMEALRKLKSIFENDCGLLYHTSAYAYVKRRSTIDAIKKHQKNESKWFAKFDLTDFFGSTTLDFILRMFSKVYPLSEVMRTEAGKKELSTAVELAILDGGLPQGTPVSPTITNIMMIPIDHQLTKAFRSFNHQSFIYTRYADDFLISSKYNFKYREVEKHIKAMLQAFNAPFTIKSEKTRYGSSAGSNWNLGLMLNKDNEITVGHRAKKHFQTMLANYAMDKKNNKSWPIADVQTLDGYRNYYRMVEGEVIDRIVAHIGKKFGVNIPELIHGDLAA